MALDDLLESLASAPDLEAALEREADALAAALGALRITVFERDWLEPVIRTLVMSGTGGRLRLPVRASHSIAGYVAWHRREVNVGDVRAAEELAALDPELRWLATVDERLAHVTVQVLALPLVTSGVGNLVGVLQLVNALDGRRFDATAQARASKLAQVLAARMAERPEALKRRSFLEERAAEAARMGPTLAQWRAAAGEAMAPEARGPGAHARERMLQYFRRHSKLTLENLARLDVGLWYEWGPWECDAMEWICSLADTGHWGARRVRDRMLCLDTPIYRRNMTHYHPIADGGGLRPEVRDLAARTATVALAFALHIASRANSEARYIAEWLALVGPSYAGLAAQLREAYAAGEPMPHWEVDIVREHLDAARGIGTTRCDSLLEHLRDERRRKVEAKEQAERARQQKSWLEEYAASPDRPAFIRTWLASAPPPPAGIREQALVAGAAHERGWLGTENDLAAAMAWYERLGLPAGVPDGRYCALLAANFEVFAEDEEMALRWYGRGAVLNHPACFARWFRACAAGELGASTDPAPALAAARRFADTGGTFESPEHLELAKQFPVLKAANAEAKILARASADLVAGNLAEALAWIEALALCGSAQGRHHLDALRAVGATDLVTARATFVQSLCSWHDA